MAGSIRQISDSIWAGRPNLSFMERAAYVVVGLGLAAAGAKPRPNPLLNILALSGGALIAWSGYKGYCPVKAALVDQSASTSAGNRIAEEPRSLPASTPMNG